MSTNSRRDLYPINIEQMKQQYGVPDDLDWTGITDPAERRRRQNCLNQRIYRTKRQTEKLNRGISASRRAQRPTALDKDGVENSSPSHANSAVTSVTTNQPSCINSHPRVTAIMSHFAQYAYERYQQGNPALEHLPLLIQFNVNAAFEHIASVMGVMDDHHDYEAISPFNKHGPSLGLNSTLPSTNWPKSLHPTSLQFAVEHHPWIDLFPFPRLRDNLIMAVETAPKLCDEDELCRDLCQYDGDMVQKSSLLVWGEASNPLNWEASLMFIKKWGFLLYGCEDLLEATNYWRARRGEQRISANALNTAIIESYTKALSSLGS